MNRKQRDRRQVIMCLLVKVQGQKASVHVAKEQKGNGLMQELIHRIMENQPGSYRTRA